MAATRAAGRLVLARRRARRPRRADAAAGARLRRRLPRLPAAARARDAGRPAARRARAQGAAARGRGGRQPARSPRTAARRSASREPDEDEIALVVHTSGTTRAPRPVELTFGNLAAHIRAAGAVLGSDPDERWLCPMPLSHVGGLMILVRSAAAAGTVVLEPGRSTPTASRGSCARATSRSSRSCRRCSRASSTPAAARARGCGACCSAAARCRPALLRRAVDAGFPVSQTYGLTEACSTVTLAEPGDLETAGRALPGHRADASPPTARSSSPARPWWGSGTRCAPATSAASTTRAA